MSRLLRILGVFLLFFALSTPSISAQQRTINLPPQPTLLPASPEGWYIDSFQSNIAIQQDGTVQITETIAVDFSDLDKHGIYRDLPVTYETENGGKLYTTIDVTDVQRDGNNEPFEEQNNGNNLRIKIGDADVTISGKHIYTIVYTATGVISAYDNFDELYWNVTGNGWPVPILAAEAEFTLPSGSIEKISCYEGVKGSTDYCDAGVSGSLARANTTEYLQPYAGMTVAIGFPKGTVPILTVSQTQAAASRYWSWLLLPIPIILTFFFLLIKWYTSGRDSWKKQRFVNDPNATEETKPLGAHETIVVEYDPPEKLRPAELGVLMDEKADTHDVTATIVDLAGRGYLTITEQEKKGWFGGTDYIMKKTDKKDENLLAYEKLLVDKLFATGNEVALSSLKMKFHKDLKSVKDALYKQVTEEKLFHKDPESVRSTYTLIGFVLLFGLFFTGVFAVLPSLLPLMIGCGISGLLFLLFAKVMPQRTAQGRELYRRAKGYELFLDKAEQHRQQFFERKNMFNEILPYVIVLGLTDKYMKAFKDLGIEPPQPTWYYATTPFNLNSFNNEINTFSQTLSSTMASAPRSSGSGGGGFSGGGMGGGGGGSW